MEFRSKPDGSHFPLSGRDNSGVHAATHGKEWPTPTNEGTRIEVSELELFAENDYETYQQVYKPWIDWAYKRISQGKGIDLPKLSEAIKKYKVKTVEDQYGKHFGKFQTSPETKRALSERIANKVFNTAVENYASDNNMKYLTVLERAKHGHKEKKYYVTMTDKFMSGWGRAEGKINKLVIEADSYDEAATVAANAKSRSEMKNINITSKKPRYDAKRVELSLHSKSDYPTWFKPNAFKR